jgi:predicted DCC family thiol-disulfide oxidoreductase YuxK
MGGVATLILYDGLCGLCNRLNQFILRRDAHDRFRFAALQGALAGDLLRRHGRDARDLDTVFVVKNYGEPGQTLLSKGRAIIFVLRTLGGLWTLAWIFNLLPRRLLDAAYDQIARRRYRWFGRYDACPLPAPGVRQKFLDGGG